MTSRLWSHWSRKLGTLLVLSAVSVGGCCDEPYNWGIGDASNDITIGSVGPYEAIEFTIGLGDGVWGTDVSVVVTPAERLPAGASDTLVVTAVNQGTGEIFTQSYDDLSGVWEEVFWAFDECLPEEEECAFERWRVEVAAGSGAPLIVQVGAVAYLETCESQPPSDATVTVEVVSIQ